MGSVVSISKVCFEAQGEDEINPVQAQGGCTNAEHKVVSFVKEPDSRVSEWVRQAARETERLRTKPAPRGALHAAAGSLRVHEQELNDTIDDCLHCGCARENFDPSKGYYYRF